MCLGVIHCLLTRQPVPRTFMSSNNKIHQHINAVYNRNMRKNELYQNESQAELFFWCVEHFISGSVRIEECSRKCICSFGQYVSLDTGWENAHLKQFSSRQNALTNNKQIVSFDAISLTRWYSPLRVVQWSFICRLTHFSAVFFFLFLNMVLKFFIWFSV